MTMERLFSYGTLQLPQVQIETFGRYLNGTRDILHGYILEDVEINDEEVIRKSGKRIHPMLRKTGNPDDTIEGVIFEITPEELAESDKYEVDAYQRICASFASGNKAWVYVEAE